MAIEITARKREAQGTASRRLRNGGQGPGTFSIGATSGPVNIELDHRTCSSLRNERFPLDPDP